MAKQSLLAPTKRSTASDMHRKILALVKKIYEGYVVLEEEMVRVQESGRSQSLYVDILIKDIKVCIECNGEQHYKFIPHFHQSERGFEDQKRRDQLKADAIKNAGYALVVIRFDEYEKMTASKLQKRISKAIKESV